MNSLLSAISDDDKHFGRNISSLLNETTGSKQHIYYPPNENLVIEWWLRDFMWFSAAFSVTLAVLVFIFQIAHPRSR